MPLGTLKAGIIYAMKENLNIQFVYPCYELPQDYLEVIDTIDHINIQPACKVDDGDIVVFDCIADTENAQLRRGISYVLRIDKFTLFSQVDNVCALLSQVDRLNVVLTDVETFSDEDFVVYKKVLNKLAVAVETACLNSKNIQCNLLTDRMMLDRMNNCGAGDTTITLAPDGKFYICPAFYLENQEDALGDLKHSIGDLDNGLDIKILSCINLTMLHFAVIVMLINVSAVFG